MKKICVGLLGFGTVGSAVARIIAEQASSMQSKIGISIRMKYIYTRTPGKIEASGIDGALSVEEPGVMFEDPEVDAVLELMGGTDTAKELVIRALQSGKHVITANKALLAESGRELFALARKNRAVLGFEASCLAGVPVIRGLTGGMLANDIDAVYGIVNGTCNFILSSMVTCGLSYEEALEKAKEQGYAEADPFLDVSGTDSAHKLAIMGSLAFGEYLPLEKIRVAGIEKITRSDIETGREMGYVTKLLAVALRKPEGCSAWVEPAFIPKSHPLARVFGSFNAVSLYGNFTGHTLFHGRGAGGFPTASGIVADILSLAQGHLMHDMEHLKIWPDITREAEVKCPEEEQGCYYLRIRSEDRKGLISRLTHILGDHDINISGVKMDATRTSVRDRTVSSVITTYTTLLGKILEALKEIDGLSPVSEPSVYVRIIEHEHKERILC